MHGVQKLGKSITTRTRGRDLELLDLVRGAGFLIVVLTHCADFPLISAAYQSEFGAGADTLRNNH